MVGSLSHAPRATSHMSFRTPPLCWLTEKMMPDKRKALAPSWDKSCKFSCGTTQINRKPVPSAVHIYALSILTAGYRRLLLFPLRKGSGRPPETILQAVCRRDSTLRSSLCAFASCLLSSIIGLNVFYLMPDFPNCQVPILHKTEKCQGFRARDPAGNILDYTDSQQLQ